MIAKIKCFFKGHQFSINSTQCKKCGKKLQYLSMKKILCEKCCFKNDKSTTSFLQCDNCQKKFRYLGYGVWVDV
jgi:hypothetical protein